MKDTRLFVTNKWVLELKTILMIYVFIFWYSTHSWFLMRHNVGFKYKYLFVRFGLLIENSWLESRWKSNATYYLLCSWEKKIVLLETILASELLLVLFSMVHKFFKINVCLEPCVCLNKHIIIIADLFWPSASHI